MIYGSEAWAEVRNTTHPDQEGPSKLTLQPRAGIAGTSTLAWKNAVRANLEQFALSIEGRAFYPFTDEQIVSNIAVLEAVARSVTTGRTEFIPHTGRPL